MQATNRQPDDLARRLIAVLETAETTVRVLLGRGFAPTDDAEEPRPEKVLSETALLLLFAARIDPSYRAVHERINSIAKQLAPYARSESVLSGIKLAPALAQEYSAAHACLSRLGYPDPDFDHALEESLLSDTARARERIPYRQLELEWLSTVWDPRPSPPTQDPGLPARTTAGLGLDALGSARDDIYAFTHSLVYLTDFGRSTDRLPRATVALVDDAECALARCMDDDDFDLCGELLLTWPLLRAAMSASGAFSFHVLSGVEDEVGFLPSLSLSADRYHELEGVARTRYTVAQAYHTVYVMGLLCAAMLQTASPPPDPIALEGCTGISDELTAEFIARDPQPQWIRYFSDLEPSQREALAPFLAAVALHRAVAGSDLGRVRSILALCVEHNLTPSGVMMQAAELLRRFATNVQM
jgi:hypothetical protein